MYLAREGGLLLHWLNALGPQPRRSSCGASILDVERLRLCAGLGPSSSNNAVGGFSGRRDSDDRSLWLRPPAAMGNNRRPEILDPVRRVAITGLGRQLGQHPDAERMLQLAAAHDAPPDLRRLAAELLAGRQG